MKRIVSVLAALVTLSLLCGAFAPTAAAAIDTAGYAAEVVSLVNAERATAGKAALQFGSKKLNDAALQRAKEYAADYTIEHKRPDGRELQTIFTEYGITWTACGENLAAWQATPADAVAAWMASEGHRKNILGEVYDYNWIGVGVCEGLDGKLYWVQLFVTSSALANDGDTNPPGAIVTPGGGGGGGGGSTNFFTGIWNWIMSIWNSIAGFFRSIFSF